MAAHARVTGALARRFAGVFGAGELGWALGIAHDAGKCAEDWQGRLVSAARTGGRVGGDHWSLGAALVALRGDAAALAVLGHHAGLGFRGDMVSLRSVDRARFEDFFAEVPEARRLLTGTASLLPRAWSQDQLVLDMGIRLAFSALVDADFLDTAAHFDGVVPRVAADADMEALFRRFEAARASRLSAADGGDLNVVRSRLYDDVVRQAGLETGVFRLPAPTGSGKTMTTAGFALRHAAIHGKSRVIMAVPFTTITEQNAAVYRDLLGEEAVLEHHSNVELDGRSQRLGAENWDAPFVVTTTVQLFDSLFGNKPARSRKLHRLANAVVVLDEVQSLPVDLLEPILSALRVLAENFGTTVVLASATQPAFESIPAWRELTVTDLVVDSVALYTRLRRVEYEWRLDPRPTWEQLASEVAQCRQALVVVNTVRQARMVFRLLRELGAPVVHLSTRMCPLHRKVVLADVVGRLRAGEPIVVVSTQLIEAGVDVDFPVVFRALAPAEALQQAAGRANREGKLAGLGRVVIFDAAESSIPEFYKAGVDKTLSFFGPDKARPVDPVVMGRYFRSLYLALNPERDKRALSIQQARKALDFATVAQGPKDMISRNRSLAFRMIKEDPVSLVVPGYGDGGAESLLALVRAGEGSLREVFRELRGYVVSLPRAVLA
ncbi:MAG: CRISPR-associated helicase Cas3', partial [Actinomycetota bacterium]|nr:CRISPR-associated helicase Cas3' [Actinomycetota bacterium]